MNAKRKGNTFERQAAKIISCWLTNNADAYAVSRDASSGGANRHKSGLTEQSGDLVAVKSSTQWFFSKVSVELKHYANLKQDLWNLIAGKPNKIIRFINQAKADANIYNRKFILIIKSNNIEPIIVTDITMAWTSRIKIDKDSYNINTFKYLVSVNAGVLV